MVVTQVVTGTQKGGLVAERPAARRLGEYIRQLREARGWKIEYVARQLNWSTSYLQYLETRKRSFPEPEEIAQLARLFNVSRDDLLNAAGYTEDPAA